MALRHDDLNPEESARQLDLDRSWRAAQASMADPEFRAYLERSIARVNESDATPISAEQFLAQTELSTPT
jgi:hypothetical protein